MKALSPRAACAKNSSTIFPEPADEEDSSPLLVIDPPAPDFEPPPPSSAPPDALLSDPLPLDPSIPPYYRNISRKVLYWLRPRVQSCEHVQIWTVALNRTCDIVGSSCIAQGGLARVHIALSDLILKSRSMGACGILLVQNRPGSAKGHVSISADSTLQVALLCELLGMPLIDHIYLNSRGEPIFVRERGALKALPGLLCTIRKRRDAIAKEVWEKGLLEEDYYEKKGEAKREAARAAAPAVEIQRLRPR
jgi:RadC-like JAB domain